MHKQRNIKVTDHMKTPLFNHLLVVILITCNVKIIQAQKIIDNQLSIPPQSEFNDHRIIYFNQGGLFMIAGKILYNDYQIQEYSANLELTKDTIIKVPENYKLRSDCNSGHEYHMLFVKNNTKEFIYFKINPNPLTVTQAKGIIDDFAHPFKLHANDENAFLTIGADGGTTVYKIDQKSGLTKKIEINPGSFKSREVSVSRIEFGQVSDDAFLYVKVRHKTNLDLYVLQLPKNEGQQNWYYLSQNTDKRFSDPNVTEIKNNQLMFTGSYSEHNSTLVSGLYLSNITNGKLEYTNLINFIKFQEILDYSSKMENRNAAKAAKKYNGKKREPFFYFEIAFHSIEQINNKYLLVAEVFHAHLQSTASPPNSSSLVGPTYLTGYEYNNLSVIAFDAMGNMLWDKAIPMTVDYFPMKVTNLAAIEPKADHLTITYPDSNRINHLDIFADGHISNKVQSTEVLIADSLQNKTKNKIAVGYWYENYYLVYGATFEKDEDRRIGILQKDSYYIKKTQ